MNVYRTPISVLQEVCVKKGITPMYELISNEGPIHEPNYVFLCTAGQFSATSKGASKKKAKHQASYLVLLKMSSHSSVPQCDKDLLRDLHHSAGNLLSTEFLDSLETDYPELAFCRGRREEESNFVGQLQEVCQRRMWPPPTYEFITLPQPVHEYECRAKLWKWQSGGYGSSKKLAKRSAAGALLERIRSENLSIPPEALESMEEANLSLLGTDLQPDTREPKMDVVQNTKLASKALRWLCDSKGVRLPPPSVDLENMYDPCSILEELCETIKLSVIYTDIKQTKTESVYCLIELSTTPPHVMKSMKASNSENARQNAAARAIIFLSTMCSDAPVMDYNKWFNPYPKETQMVA